MVHVAVYFCQHSSKLKECLAQPRIDKLIDETKVVEMHRQSVLSERECCFVGSSVFSLIATTSKKEVVSCPNLRGFFFVVILAQVFYQK